MREKIIEILKKNEDHLSDGFEYYTQHSSVIDLETGVSTETREEAIDRVLGRIADEILAAVKQG